MEKVSVLIASANKGLCQSLEKVLTHQEWIQIVGTSVSKSRTLELAKKFSPQVIVIDFSIAGEDLEISKQISKLNPNAKVIVLSKYDLVGKVSVKRVSKNAAPELDSVDWLSKKSSPASLLKLIFAAKEEPQVH